MIYIKKYNNFILEHKFWGKSIQEFLDWIKSKSNRYWVWLDTETTGLTQYPYDVQLTQVSCIVTKYNFDTNSFEEIDSYDKKIKLTSYTKSLMNSEENRIRKVLSFNHYGQKELNIMKNLMFYKTFLNF